MIMIEFCCVRGDLGFSNLLYKKTRRNRIAQIKKTQNPRKKSQKKKNMKFRKTWKFSKSLSSSRRSIRREPKTRKTKRFSTVMNSVHHSDV